MVCCVLPENNRRFAHIERILHPIILILLHTHVTSKITYRISNTIYTYNMEEVVVCALICLFAMNRARDYLEDRYDRILSLLEGESFDSKI